MENNSKRLRVPQRNHRKDFFKVLLVEGRAGGKGEKVRREKV